MADIFPGATLIQLVEWGYPMGHRRPTPDPALAYSVVHITANTALAENEARYRLNDPGLQNSATFFVNQDGSVVQCLEDPLHMDPWTNGDVNRPNLSNPRIAHMVSSGVNANERSLVTIENVGREPANPITPAQEATSAAIIAYYHAKAGVPVNRQTVIGHYEINSVDRPNCPSTDKSILDRIVALAGGDNMPSLKLISYPDGPHSCEIPAGGTVQGWSDTALVISQTFPTGSSFPADCKVEITQNPSRPPEGLFYHCSAGIFAGLYVPTPHAVDAGPLLATPGSGPDPVVAAKEAADAVAAAAADKAAEF